MKGCCRCLRHWCVQQSNCETLCSASKRKHSRDIDTGPRSLKAFTSLLSFYCWCCNGCFFCVRYFLFLSGCVWLMLILPTFRIPPVAREEDCVLMGRRRARKCQIENGWRDGKRISRRWKDKVNLSGTKAPARHFPRMPLSRMEWRVNGQPTSCSGSRDTGGRSFDSLRPNSATRHGVSSATEGWPWAKFMKVRVKNILQKLCMPKTKKWTSFVMGKKLKVRERQGRNPHKRETRNVWLTFGCIVECRGCVCSFFRCLSCLFVLLSSFFFL